MIGRYFRKALVLTFLLLHGDNDDHGGLGEGEVCNLYFVPGRGVPTGPHHVLLLLPAEVVLEPCKGRGKNDKSITSMHITSLQYSWYLSIYLLYLSQGGRLSRKVFIPSIFFVHYPVLFISHSPSSSFLNIAYLHTFSTISIKPLQTLQY